MTQRPVRSIFNYFKTTSDWKSFTPGLERVTKALADLRNPDCSFKSITIGGTNGKGTVTYNLAKRLGPETGLFQSPHQIDIRERITHASKWIEDAYWERAYEEIKAKTEGKFSYYEWLFLIACLMFKYSECKWAVFEVGMGGRLDAVNALEPVCAGLTTVSLDHERYLGSTKAEIAREKVDICRYGKPLFIPSRILNYSEVKRVLERKKPQVIELPNADTYAENRYLIDAISDYIGCEITPFTAPPGRREILGSSIYIDTAHNEEAWLDTLKWLQSEDISQINILFALTRDRKPKIFKEIFQPVARAFYVWNGELAHSIPRRDYELAGVHFIDTLEDLMVKPLFVCGSHSLVGMVKKRLKKA